MSFIVQSDDGDVAGANAYLTVAEFSDYHASRGNSIPGTPTDDVLQAAIIRATDYLDQRFMFVGRKVNGRDQTTAWPRSSAFDCSGDLVQGIPQEVKDATAEYALRALSAVLNPDPVRSDSGAAVQSETKVVGPIEKSVTYVEGATFTMPKYPAADQKLRRSCLVLSGGTLMRG